MKERIKVLKFKYLSKSLLYILFGVVVWQISASFSKYRIFYLLLMIIISLGAMFYDYLKYKVEIIMGMVAEASDIQTTIELIKEVEKLDFINGLKNSLVLPKLLLFLDDNKPQDALNFLEANDNFMRSQLDYLLIYKYVTFKAHSMLEEQDKAIDAYKDLLKLKETNLKNKKMKLLFNWQQIEALYELQIKNYKRCKNLYNACNITKYNNRELMQFYYEKKCLAIKTNDRSLFNTCEDKMIEINRNSPLNIDWR